MKIVEAIDLGYKKVIKVVLNPDDPEWVHVVGDVKLGPDGNPALDAAGNEVKITSTVVPPGETGNRAEEGKTLCHNCRNNWVKKEKSWAGQDLLKLDGKIWVSKTDEDLEQELVALFGADPAPVAMANVGKTL